MQTVNAMIIPVVVINTDVTVVGIIIIIVIVMD